jgi:hypothetical protein
MPHTIQQTSDSTYNISLHTHNPGKYRIYVYFNGTQVKGIAIKLKYSWCKLKKAYSVESLKILGSPFPLRVGTREQMRAERHSKNIFYSAAIYQCCYA